MPAIAENIKKVAVTLTDEKPQFIELDQGRPLAAVIKDLCKAWNISDHDAYALQFDDDSKKSFITEHNRHEIQNGNVMKLTFSAAKTAQDLLSRLQGGTEVERGNALQQLCELSKDITFAHEFILNKGHSLLITLIESGSSSKELLSQTLRVFLELMDHGIVSWNVLEPKFIKTISSVVNTKVPLPAGRQPPNAPCCLQSSLEIIELIVLHSTGKYECVEQEVPMMCLIHHLQSSEPKIQKNAIALINALLHRADDMKRKNVIRSSIPIGKEMEHQLYVLQRFMFTNLEHRRDTKVELNDQNALKEITNLRKVAFDNESDVGTRKQGHTKDYHRLGFTNNVNPLEDFTVTPPGVLALDNMAYFAKMHGEDYTKVVLENSCKADEHDCPFAKASIELTKMMCDILKVGEQPTDEGQEYYPMFFTQDRPFEEFYCICVQLLNKTWKEMRATSHDFTKVLSVVKEQVLNALETHPKTFEQFRSKLSQLTYAEITNLWQQERRHKEEWESQATPIVELREQVKPEIMQLIKQQRLKYLVEGTLFKKSSKGARMKGKYWCCRLSPNHKVFHYGDCDEDTKPSIELLPNKLAVVDIKQLVVGKDCPHVKDIRERDRQKKLHAMLAFSILPEPDMADPLNFTSLTESDYHMWTDGINALSGNEMISEQTKQDLELLLGMEIKLRLLDTEGVTIPETPPPIPKEPPNYDFTYKT